MYMDKYNNNEEECMEFEFLREYLKKDKIKVVNPLRRRDIILAYNIIKKLIGKQEETTIEIEPGKLELGDVSIRITALSITIFDLKSLMQAFHKANNIDIYPHTDGTVTIDIQFYDVYSVQILE